MSIHCTRLLISGTLPPVEGPGRDTRIAAGEAGISPVGIMVTRLVKTLAEDTSH